MKTLHVNVVNKIATYLQRDGDIVCGNSDYKIAFTFDSEWDAHPTKTARFVWNGEYFDVEFTGDICEVPVVRNTVEVEVGVYAGDLSTTTAATIGCKKGILCGSKEPNPGTGQHYSNEAKVAAEIAVSSATIAEEAAEEAKSLLSGTTRIVQTTGDDNTVVMSQKAVTEELDTLVCLGLTLKDGVVCQKYRM